MFFVVITQGDYYIEDKQKKLNKVMYCFTFNYCNLQLKTYFVYVEIFKYFYTFKITPFIKIVPCSKKSLVIHKHYIRLYISTA